MRVLAYISDEMYLAIANADAEFQSMQDGTVTMLRSSPTGALYGDLPNGSYRVTLAKDGYGAKTVVVELGEQPLQLRLLSNKLIGYAWPKWVRARRKGRVPHQRHRAIPAHALAIRTEERIRQNDRLDGRARSASEPSDPSGHRLHTDRSRDGTKQGYSSPPLVTAPERSGLYYFWARTPSNESFSFPWVVAPASPKAKIAVLASTNTWNAYNNFGGRSNYVNSDRLPDRPVVNSRQDLDRYQNPASFGTWRPKDEEYRPLSFDRPEPNNHHIR